MGVIRPLDTMVCALGTELCELDAIDLNISLDIQNDAIYEWPREEYFDLLVDPVNSNWDKYFDIDECIFPNFYCDTVNTTYYCDQEEELSWLEEFYHSTNGDNWINNTNWLITNDNTSYCDWHGIRCCSKIVNYNKTTGEPYITPLSHSCLNMIKLSDNNVTGTFPDYWFESTIFTILSIRGKNINNTYADPNSMHGIIPQFKYYLPNLAVLHLPYNKFNESIPDFGNSHCTFDYDLSVNSFNTTLPDWSNETFIVSFQAGSNIDIYGTIPDWSGWIWPFKLVLERCKNTDHDDGRHCSLTGTIPDMNRHACPTLMSFKIDGAHLDGMLQRFPNTLCRTVAEKIRDLQRAADVTIDLSYNQLSGTVPFNTLGTGVRYLGLENNKLSGKVDFSVQDRPVSNNSQYYNFTFNYNHTHNDNGGGKVNNVVKALIGINLTDNNFHGTFPCLSDNVQLVYIDIRSNNFKSIEKKCKWSTNLKYFLASENRVWSQAYTDVTYGMINLSILAIENTDIYGSIPNYSPAINYGGDYMAFYDTDIYGHLPKILRNAVWNTTWVIIGLSMYLPVPSYVSPIESKLAMILIPNYELWMDLIIPICLMVVAIIIYVVLFKGVFKISFSKYLNNSDIDDESLKHLLHNRPSFCQSLTQHDKRFVETSHEYHKIMIISHKFLFSLLLPSLALVIIYYLGSNWTDDGYHSLKISATYLGSHKHSIYDEFYVGASLFMFIIYSWICAWYSVEIIKQCEEIAIRATLVEKGLYPQEHASRSYSSYIGNTKSNSNSVISIHSRSSNIIVNNNDDDYNFNQLQGAEDDKRETHLFPIDSKPPTLVAQPRKNKLIVVGKLIIFIVALFVFCVIMLLPIGLYNLFQSLSTENTLPLLSNASNWFDKINNHFGMQRDSLFFTLVEELTAIIIAIQQWFVITPCINLLYKLFPFKSSTDAGNSSYSYNKNDTIKYLILQSWRNIAFIIVPFVVLLIFDDKCFQNWKKLWPYCDENYANNFLNENACKTFESPTIYGKFFATLKLCFPICEQTFVGHRCARQIFQVLGPLYTIKATVGLFFPLLRYLQIYLVNYCQCDCTCVSKITIHKSCCKRRSRDCKSKKRKKKRKKKNKKKRKIEETTTDDDKEKGNKSLEIEYIGLISSLEIVIVFGWGLPVLVFLYNVVIIGYGLVYYYWLFNYDCFDYFNLSGRSKEQQRVFTIKQITYMKTVGKWLLFSIVIQQLLAFVFYAYSQVYVEYAIVVGVNFGVLIVIVVKWIRMWSKQRFASQQDNVENVRNNASEMRSDNDDAKECL